MVDNHELNICRDIGVKSNFNTDDLLVLSYLNFFDRVDLLLGIWGFSVFVVGSLSISVNYLFAEDSLFILICHHKRQESRTVFIHVQAESYTLDLS